MEAISMNRIVLAVLAASIPFCLAAQDSSLSTASPLLFSLHEMSVDLSSHGITANSCISVTPEGRFHIERRFQQLPNSQATLHIYESSFDGFQMQRLKNLLDSQSIRDLGRYTHPVTPMSVSYFSSVDVRVPREHTFQSIGYFVWDERTAIPNESPDSTPKTIKGEWTASRTTLTPLVQWFHEVEGMKWPEVPESRSTVCDTDLTAQNAAARSRSEIDPLAVQ
jgi:hypothetical protein